jgi:predicted TIM-barrel fold metal-dependent hydrolase
MARLKFIGVEEHGWTAGIRDAVTSLPEDRRDPSVGYFNTGETDERLLDYDEDRLRNMDAMGMDMAVLSVTTPATQILDAPEAVRLARQANEQLAAAVARHPDRLQAFATLPTPDPVAAVDELQRAVLELGLRGAMIHGRTGDKMLDHPDFAPILDEAARLGAPIFIHPQMPPKSRPGHLLRRPARRTVIHPRRVGMARGDRHQRAAADPVGYLRAGAGSADHPRPLGGDDPPLPRALNGERLLKLAG